MVVVKWSGIACNLYSAAEVARHRRICLTIVIMWICCLNCNITLYIVAWAVRTAAPLRLCVCGMSRDRWTPSSLWWKVRIFTGWNVNVIGSGCDLHSISGRVTVMGVGDG